MMAESVTPGMKTRTYNTQRFKRRTAETEERDTLTVKAQDNYFERVSLLHYFVIIFGLVIFEILCFQADIFPFELLGQLGAKLQYLVSNHLGTMRIIFVFTVVLHLFEAVYANYQCGRANLTDSATQKWMVQTFILGYGSLRILNKYCERKGKAH